MLWSIFAQRQVDSISESSKMLRSPEWSKLTLEILCRSVDPICTMWLATEPCLVNAELQTTLELKEQSVMKPMKASRDLTDAPGGDLSQRGNASRTRQGRKLVLDFLQESGKTELYVDLLFYLRFQTVRPGGCCDYMLMSRHVGNALEDLVVALADGAAAIYLGRDSVLGGSESSWPTLMISSIKSTRSLERFRNEVALRNWLQRNFTSVVAIFEDRFELWTVEAFPGSSGVTGSGTQQQAKVDDSAKELRLTRAELPARRSKELRALTGWRYFYSLYLEFSDVVGPLIRVLILKLGDAVSFLLVRLIGRSLGLIFEGIRQSVRWSSK